MPKFAGELKNNLGYLLLMGSAASLIIQGVILTYNLDQWVDIRLWDESMYLGKGLNFFIEKPVASWGPIYSLWYFLLNIISNDPINLYYLNYKLMAIVPAVLLLIYLYRLTANHVLSFFFSYLFLISTINLATWPRVSHFALIIMLTTLILIIKIRDKKIGLVVVCLASLVITYVRPEFMLSFLITLIMLIVWIVRGKLKVTLILPVMFGSIIMLFIFGIPYSSDRNLVAFGQGFEKNISFDERIENGEAKDYTQILSENFRDANSLSEIIINNSNKFLNHIVYNIKRLPKILLNYSELILPTNIIRVNYKVASVFLLLVVCSIPFVLFLAAKRDHNSGKKKSYDRLIFISFITIIFAFPPFLSLTLYFPRAHYLLLLLPFFYTYLSAIAISIKIKNNFIELFTFVLIVFLSFIFLPKMSSYFNKSTFPNRKTISYLKELNVKRNINILGDGGGLHYFPGNNYKLVRLSLKDKPFDNFLRNKKIDIVIASQKLNQSSSLRNDSTWFDFLNNSEPMGFRKIIINGEVKVYLKEGL